MTQKSSFKLSLKKQQKKPKTTPLKWKVRTRELPSGHFSEPTLREGRWPGFCVFQRKTLWTSRFSKKKPKTKQKKPPALSDPHKNQNSVSESLQKKKLPGGFESFSLSRHKTQTNGNKNVNTTHLQSEWSFKQEEDRKLKNLPEEKRLLLTFCSGGGRCSSSSSSSPSSSSSLLHTATWHLIKPSCVTLFLLHFLLQSRPARPFPGSGSVPWPWSQPAPRLRLTPAPSWPANKPVLTLRPSSPSARPPASILSSVFSPLSCQSPAAAAVDPADRSLCFPPQAAKPISVSDSRPPSLSSTFQKSCFYFLLPVTTKQSHPLTRVSSGRAERKTLQETSALWFIPPNHIVSVFPEGPFKVSGVVYLHQESIILAILDLILLHRRNPTEDVTTTAQFARAPSTAMRPDANDPREAANFLQRRVSVSFAYENRFYCPLMSHSSRWHLEKHKFPLLIPFGSTTGAVSVTERHRDDVGRNNRRSQSQSEDRRSVLF